MCLETILWLVQPVSPFANVGLDLHPDPVDLARACRAVYGPDMTRIAVQKTSSPFSYTGPP